MLSCCVCLLHALQSGPVEVLFQLITSGCCASSLPCFEPQQFCAGREVYPVLRYRDADGNAFIRTDDVDTDSPSFSQIRPADLLDSLSSAGSESDSESGPEIITPLQRLQRAAAGSVKQIVKRRTPAKPGQPQVEQPETHPLQVYVHGIAEDVINSALRKSSLSHKIQLKDSLQVMSITSALTPYLWQLPLCACTFCSA